MESQRAENLEKKRIGLELAYEAVLTDDAAKILAYGRNKNRRHEANIALLGGREIKDQQIEDEDDVIHVGDIITHQHMPGSAHASASADASSSAPAPAPPTGATKISKLAGAAALAAGTLGVGASLPAALDAVQALTSAAAEVRVLWDGEEIRPGETATATGEQNR